MKTIKPPPYFNRHNERRLTLSIQSTVKPARVPRGRLLQRWARTAVRPNTRSAQVLLRVTDTDEGRRINRDYCGKDYATNVLTFILHEGKEPLASGNDRLLSGDIILVAPVIEEEARELGLPLEAHYAHLIIHGMLHLQGYDHQNATEANIMETLEATLLQSLGYSDPYDPR